MGTFLQENGAILASLLLAATVPMVIYLGMQNRNAGKGKGIGWQFLRFLVISISLPIIGVLA